MIKGPIVIGRTSRKDAGLELEQNTNTQISFQTAAVCNQISWFGMTAFYRS